MELPAKRMRIHQPDQVGEKSVKLCHGGAKELTRAKKSIRIYIQRVWQHERILER
jgi:hypothetical protein